jgi:hypothetical protein
MGHRRLLLVIATALLAIAVLGGAWVGAGWIWDGANAIGFAAAALLIFLHIETGAARNRPVPHAAFHARLHSNVAVMGLVLVVVHVGALLLDDSVTIEYWKLSAPHYMLAGIFGLVVMSAIVASAYPKPRRLLFESPAQFRRVHGAASLVLTALVAWHVAGSALYLDTRLKQGLFVATLVGLPFWLMRRPAVQRPLATTRSSIDTPRREAIEARREAFYIGIVALSIAAAFSALRNLL